MLRVAVWITGAVALALYIWVALFAFGTLGKALACPFGPEIRFWGYDAAGLNACFFGVDPGVVAEYQGVLLGSDRMLAVALGTFLVLWSIRERVWIGLPAGVLYGVADWTENGALVAALDGDAAAVSTASVMTSLKFLGLVVALILCWRAARRRGRQ